MSTKKGESKVEFEVSPKATLSRTLIPVLPPNFLSRKHLFHLLDNPASGTTIVIAPAGYGKTTLVAEWAQTERERVIWLTLTERDSLSDMAILFIQATRNLIPGFAPWFDQEPAMRPVEIVRRWGNDLLATGKDYIFVIDNLRERTTRDVDIAVKLVEQFPQNVQFVSIRRDTIENVYATFSSRGPLKVVGAQDLIFSNQEIDSLTSLYSVDIDLAKVREVLKSANGWPSAVSMLLYKIQKNGVEIDFEKILSSQSEPLRVLATLVIEDLSPEIYDTVVPLSIIQEFSHEQAQVILGEKYSYDRINQIAFDGNFFSKTSDPHSTFEFSKLMRETLLVKLRADKYRKMSLHSKLMAFHENRNEPNLALEHAFLAEDLESVREIFPDAARLLQATGQGRELIRWSIFAGDTSRDGLLKRATVELAGYLADRDYQAVQSLINKMTFDAKESELEVFIKQIACAARAHLDIAFAHFDNFEENFNCAMQPQDGPLVLAADEQLALLRLAAIRAFNLDDSQVLSNLLAQANNVATASRIPQAQLLLTSIKALSLFQAGDYRHAYEMAQLHYSQTQKQGYVGFFGPMESIFIMARCLLEFSREEEAIAYFKQLSELSEQWKQWHWYFIAEGYLARDLAVKGAPQDAFEAIRKSREKLALLDFQGELSVIIDLSELFVRYDLKDFGSKEEIYNQAINHNLVKHMRLFVGGRLGQKLSAAEIATLPSVTPREKIRKHLAEVASVLDKESQALKILRSALEIGARVGAKETFLRQPPEIGALIMKIAGQNPSVYLEELSASVAERIKLDNIKASPFATPLTKREIEVLRHLSTDRPISSIAATLHISINTMKTHLKNLYRKMGAENRIAAVEKAKANFLL
jgi:ATP/maltotriose-dependent transcriptional regulator MalT